MCESEREREREREIEIERRLALFPNMSPTCSQPNKITKHQPAEPHSVVVWEEAVTVHPAYPLVVNGFVCAIVCNQREASSNVKRTHITFLGKSKPGNLWEIHENIMRQQLMFYQYAHE